MSILLHINLKDQTYTYFSNIKISDNKYFSEK